MKDVLGHVLQDESDHLLPGAWYHEYELSDGQVLDLSNCRSVHWYFLKGQVWVPFPYAERSELLVALPYALCEPLYDTYAHLSVHITRLADLSPF